MTGSVSYGNLDAREGTVSVEESITFNFKPRKIIITNDSANSDLLFKFNVSEAFATLAPTETVSLEVASKTIILQGVSIPYRVWGIG
jgi:hypothetical protein